MKKRIYNLLIDDCVGILIQDDWDSDINTIRLYVNYLLIAFFIKRITLFPFDVISLVKSLH